MATDNEDTGRGKNRQVVLRAIKELCEAKRQASRRAIADVTGLKMTIVDDHVKNLKEDELIRQVIPGVFEPVELDIDRVVSGTLVNGRYKLDVGDVCLDLSLVEARKIAMLTSGLTLLLGR